MDESEGTASTSSGLTAPASHCFVTVEPTELIQETPDGIRQVTTLRNPQEVANVPEIVCDDGLSAKQGAGSGGYVTLGQSIIGEDYTGINKTGSQLTWVVDNDYGCNTFSCGFLGLSTCWYNYRAEVLYGIWNNSILSSYAFSGCSRNVLWDLTYFYGYRRECYYNCSNVGGPFASSRKWCRAGDSYCN